MNRDLKWAKDKGIITVTISGGFDTHLIQSFHEILLEIEEMDSTIVVDLANAEFIDSSALGLLIHIKKRFQDGPIETIRIVNFNSRIAKVFQIMRFEDMFDLVQGKS